MARTSGNRTNTKNVEAERVTTRGKRGLTKAYTTTWAHVTLTNSGYPIGTTTGMNTYTPSNTATL